jgi:hypothetical protein
VVSPCSVTGITLSGTPFNPVDGYVPHGTAEYKQLLALGYIPVSGECDEACVIEVQALLSSGQLKLGPRARAAAVHLDSLGQAQLKIQHGTATVRLKFTEAGKKLLGESDRKQLRDRDQALGDHPIGQRPRYDQARLPPGRAQVATRPERVRGAGSRRPDAPWLLLGARRAELSGRLDPHEGDTAAQ